jgi:hypothetical protein
MQTQRARSAPLAQERLGRDRGARAGSTLFAERRDKKVVPIDTRSEHGSQIQHAYAHTEYREQGKNRYAELQMVDSLVHQRSLTVGVTRHTHRYEMWAPLDKVTSYANLVAFGERERNKV